MTPPSHTHTHTRDPVTSMSQLGFRRPCPQWREGLKDNQCANCTEEGHWKGECPKCLRRRLSGPPCPGPPSLVTHIKEEDSRGPGAPRSAPEITPKKPWLTLTTGGKKADFLVNTGATYWVLNTQQGKMTKDKYKIMGVKGKPQERNIIEHLECDLEGKKLSHSFLYVPECLIPLIGRDLLYKLGATIYLRDTSKYLRLPSIP